MKILVKGTNDKANKLKVLIQCQVKDVQDGGDDVTTDQNADPNNPGTCQGGPNDGLPCTKDSNCKDHDRSQGPVLLHQR